MIKKFISICSAFVLVSGLYAANANAVNIAANSTAIGADEEAVPKITGSYDNGIPYISVNEDEAFNIFNRNKNQAQELTELAVSLGADSNHFSFPNYVVTEGSDEISEMLEQAGVSYTGTLNGVCYGMSVLQVLTKNGIISPSDIQEGAETLDQITYDSDVNGILAYYSFMQLFDIQQLVLGEYYCNHSEEEIISDLISCSENAMEENNYFLITIMVKDPNSNAVAGHAIVGMGIADGSWTYEGNEYDKCILTMDSNCVDSDDKTVGVGFTEEAFIYLNSETNEYYFPAYECGSYDESVGITYIGDDTELMNYKGYINPTESYDPKYDEIKKIQIDNYLEAEYDLTVETDGKSESYHGYPYKGCEGFTKNYYTRLTGKYHFEHYRTADAITLETTGYDTESYDSGSLMLAVNDIMKGWGSNVTATSEDSLFRLRVEKNKGTFTHLDQNLEKGEFYIILGDNNYSVMPYSKVALEAFTSGEVSMELTDEGVLLCTDEGFNGFMDLYRYDLPEDDINRILTINLTSANDVMLKYDEINDDIYFTIGKNFDVPVEIGDVNCNGTIDAIDASLILTGYANVQVGNVWSYVNESLGDYNHDGTVNALDASEVLTYYAKTQVENI